MELVVEILMYGRSILFGSEKNERNKETLSGTKNIVISFWSGCVASWGLVEFRFMRTVLT